MTNEERRQALSEARSKARHYAGLAETKWVDGSKDFAQVVMLADTFANLAQALKVGDPVADNTQH